MLSGALDVVARVLLARERVELRADAVELEPDLLGCRPPLGALEEHVLGEVRDPARLRRLVARPGCEHDEARDRLDLRHRSRKQPDAVPERLALVDAHTATPWSWSRHFSGSAREALTA